VWMYNGEPEEGSQFRTASPHLAGHLQRPLEVSNSQIGVAQGKVCRGQCAQGLCLQPLITDVECNREGCVRVVAGLGWPPFVAVQAAEVIERTKFANAVRDLPEKHQRLG